MEGVAASPCDHVDLAGCRAPKLWAIVAALHLELVDRVNAWIDEQGYVGPVVDVICPVNRPVVLTLPVPIDGKADYIDCALRVGRTNVHLICRVADHTGL